MNIIKKTKENSSHYNWGEACSGWHMVQSKSLSVIEELMPPKTQETKHYHEHAQQFFRILQGTATFEIAETVIEVKRGEGLYVPPKTPHRIRNDQAENLEFLVISQPTTRGERHDVTQR